MIKPIDKLVDVVFAWFLGCLLTVMMILGAGKDEEAKEK